MVPLLDNVGLVDDKNSVLSLRLLETCRQYILRFVGKLFWTVALGQRTRLRREPTSGKGEMGKDKQSKQKQRTIFIRSKSSNFTTHTHSHVRTHTKFSPVNILTWV